MVRTIRRSMPNRPGFFAILRAAGYPGGPGAASRDLGVGVPCARSAPERAEWSTPPSRPASRGHSLSHPHPRNARVTVPFLDLRAQDAEVGAEVRAALAEVLASQQLVLGPYVERFEQAMAAYCGVPHAVGVNSGTDALALALAALGVGPGVRVLTTPFSFFATASTIARLGARPVFADIDPHTLNLDPAAAAAVLDRAGPVAGIVAVHLFGRLADMAALTALAEHHGTWLLEDAAQAVGARRDGRCAGAGGCAGALSFYPTKNLGGVGDGGMLLTADAQLAERVGRDRAHGMVGPYRHETIGLCSRLDAVQAAAVGAKLVHLDRWNARRRTVARWYTTQFLSRGLAGGPDAPLVVPA